MARAQASPILAQLRSAKTLPEQTAALRALKNEVVGHVQRKEAWISLGVLEPIVGALSAHGSPAKQNGKDTRLQFVSGPLSEEDGVKLQALQLVATFANGGPSFLPPLHAARALPAVLANISPFLNTPQIVVAALRALTDIADAATYAPLLSPVNTQTLADSLFVAQHIDSLNALLSISSSKHTLHSQAELAAGLVSRLCREDRYRQALAAAGILDSLAARLASFAVREGYVVPGAHAMALEDGLVDIFPEAAPNGVAVGGILEAVSAVLGDSKYRALRFLNSPATLAVFPSIRWETSMGFANPNQVFDFGEYGREWHQDLTAMEYLLPAVPVRASVTAQSVLPALDRSDSQTSTRTASAKLSPAPVWDTPRAQASVDGDEIECPIIPWLTYLVRVHRDHDRLAAASVLTSLFKAGLGARTVREPSMGLLVVPLLVNMLIKDEKDLAVMEREVDPVRRQVFERAPAVLARLITDSDYLQTAAFDCDAVKHLTQLLKWAYQPVQTLTPPRFWSPQPDTEMDVESQSPLSQLGDLGQSPELVYRVRVRESVLKAIGALAAGKEEYRKALVAEDAIPYIVESLSEFPQKPRQYKERAKDKESGSEPPSRTKADPKYGTNPLSVIIAGCHVVRMLARSVSILRTALVDHPVAQPILRYMKHPDVNVQIAATSTIVNLVVEVSPVREPLTQEGVMQVLCEHAHSDNPALRLNALWALKHFVDAVGPELKKACLEQLEPGWLVQLILDDSHDTSPPDSRTEEGPGKAGDDDVDMQPSEVPVRWVYGSDGSLREFDASKSTRLRKAEDELATVRDSELSPARKAHNDDIAIQEQGLDFIRNLVGRPGVGPALESAAETTEMIDYLFNELGQDRLFEILASKVRLKVTNPFSRRTPVPGRETRVLYPPARIVAAVIYVLVHIAASIPRHRQLVVAQTELLKLLAQQSANRDREVRVGLCHLVTNLTWQEDGEEMQAHAQRAQELKKLGFLAKMEMLKQSDRDLDVRERAKTAAWQMGQAIC